MNKSILLVIFIVFLIPKSYADVCHLPKDCKYMKSTITTAYNVYNEDSSKEQYLHIWCRTKMGLIRIHTTILFNPADVCIQDGNTTDFKCDW